jgi:hypothetical protein
MAVQHSILAELALRLARSPEDVATEGLAYVLGRSEAARTCVHRLAGGWAPVALRPITLFRSQVGATDGSRPDLQGHDAQGKPVVIFENKFWAGLTPAQPVEYLQRLAAQGGVLCFVAPAGRLPILWPELIQRASTGAAQVGVRRDESELKVAHVGENRSLVIVSWSFLLGQLREALEAQGELALVADVLQLIGLAARMDTSGFIPVSVTDLTAPTARHVLQFCDVVDAAVELLLGKPFASKRGLKATAAQGWYGHYLRLHGLVCFLSFDAPLWAKHGRSPIWLRTTFPESPPQIEQAIARLLGHDGYVRPGDAERPGVWVPVQLPEGCERDAVIASVVDQTLRVADVLQGIAPPDAPVVAPPVLSAAVEDAIVAGQRREAKPSYGLRRLNKNSDTRAS